MRSPSTLMARYPSQSTLRAATRPEPRRALLGVTGNGKLAADRLHAVGMQSKTGTGTGAKLDQIEGRWPETLTTLFPSVFGFALVPGCAIKSGTTAARFARRLLRNGLAAIQAPWH